MVLISSFAVTGKGCCGTLQSNGTLWQCRQHVVQKVAVAPFGVRNELGSSTVEASKVYAPDEG